MERRWWKLDEAPTAWRPSLFFFFFFGSIGFGSGHWVSICIAFSLQAPSFQPRFSGGEQPLKLKLSHVFPPASLLARSSELAGRRERDAVGLGLGDERGVTVRGLDAVRRCARVYMEAYTALLVLGPDPPSRLDSLVRAFSIRTAHRLFAQNPAWAGLAAGRRSRTPPGRRSRSRTGRW
ncbi:hypothetical protein SORBI_3001G368700 [Sorghum bicolor]|uniref:Uncharacterized protein n=2 Tax=Sorghum bicolor TaxID=4558 RepID=A0A1B6QN52_SORBI|nr:hypothetical protein SORBI_3001G368700 [Sorghum bicolor]